MLERSKSTYRSCEQLNNLHTTCGSFPNRVVEVNNTVKSNLLPFRYERPNNYALPHGASFHRHPRAHLPRVRHPPPLRRLPRLEPLHREGHEHHPQPVAAPHHHQHGVHTPLQVLRRHDLDFPGESDGGHTPGRRRRCRRSEEGVAGVSIRRGASGGGSGEVHAVPVAGAAWGCDEVSDGGSV